MGHDKLTGGVLVFAGACCFGILSTMVKMAYSAGFTPGQITGVQFFFGACGLWVACGMARLFRKASKTAHPDREWKDAWKVVVAGSCTGIVGVFYYQCVRLLPASVAIILLMQYLWMSLLIEAIFFKKVPSRLEVGAAVLVLAGTVLAGGAFSSVITLNALGVLLGLLSALLYSLFLLASGRVGTSTPPLRKSALMITGSCMAAWLVYPPMFFLDAALFERLLKWGVPLALFGAIIPPLFFSIGIPRIGISLSAILSAVELPVAVFASWLVLGEHVDSIRWVGVLCIIAAVVLPNIRSRMAS